MLRLQLCGEEVWLLLGGPEPFLAEKMSGIFILPDVFNSLSSLILIKFTPCLRRQRAKLKPPHNTARAACVFSARMRGRLDRSTAEPASAGLQMRHRKLKPCSSKAQSHSAAGAAFQAISQQQREELIPPRLRSGFLLPPKEGKLRGRLESNLSA